MSFNTIMLIKEPRFEVDFSLYKKEKIEEKKKAFLVRMGKVAHDVITALGQTLKVTAQNLWPSFKITVLGGVRLRDARLNQGFVFIAFRVCFWVLQLFVTLSVTFVRKMWEKNEGGVGNTTLHPLQCYVGPDLNPSHLVTKQLKLDTKHLPKDLDLESLLTIYSEINFTDHTKPGFMPESCRKEAGAVYTIEDLKKALETFVSVVKNRTPMLGSPPGHDIEKLLEFYEQIENATKLAIFKSDTLIATFKKEHGNDVESYGGPVKQIWCNLLEDRARIAIDLAIAGKHCAARFMGEAMSVYNSFYAQTEAFDLGLKETIIELLAYKRKEIALEKIAHRGSNTHEYGLYMSRLGKELGIPGTANIHEHLTSAFNRSLELQSFFATYNATCIIDTLQEAFKTNQRLRELFYGWLKAQGSSWNLEGIQTEINATTSAIKAIIDNPLEDFEIPTSPLEELRDILDAVAKAGGDLPDPTLPFEKFIDELLATDEARGYFNHKYADKTLIKRRGIKQEVGDRIKKMDIADSVYKKIKEEKTFLMDDFRVYSAQFAIQAEKMAKLNAIANIAPEIQQDSIHRVLSKQSSIEFIVDAAIKRRRQIKFLGELKGINEIADKGLPEELMEWMLVHFEIFKPQE